VCIGAASRRCNSTTWSTTVERVKTGRSHYPVIPADVFEGHEERFSAALGHGCATPGRRDTLPLLAGILWADLGRSLNIINFPMVIRQNLPDCRINYNPFLSPQMLRKLPAGPCRQSQTYPLRRIDLYNQIWLRMIRMIQMIPGIEWQAEESVPVMAVNLPIYRHGNISRLPINYTK